MIRNGGRYASLILGAGALLWLAQHGISPIKLRDVNEHLGQENEYLIHDQEISHTMWEELVSRKDVVFCLIWFFVTAGPTTTLPADFNTASNQINVIGNGAGGGGGQPGAPGAVGGGGGSCGGGC
jgi:uncharacterized membrane protein YgcG